MSKPIQEQYKILLVDDEESNLKMFVKEFKDRFALIACGSGKEALEILKREPSIGVIVSDQRMRGMTGVELLERVKQLYPEITRVLITGYSDINAAMDSINQGAVYKYIQKPYDEEKTFEILKDALAQHVEILHIRQSIDDSKRRIKERFIEIYESVASGIAHHINNGLVPTKTFYELLPKKLNALKEGRCDEEFFGSFLNQAGEDLKNVQKIVAMFSWVRNCHVEDFKEVPVEHLFLMDKETQAALQQRNIHLQKEIEPNLPPVLVDPLKTLEMISLLIKNCAKEAPEGSAIKIKAENGISSSVQIQISRQGPDYKSEEIPRLFDPFYKFDKSLKDGVSGLDLTNCYIIAAKHGSEIRVHSRPGKETSFSVELPTIQKEN